jgi:site-specific DNA recombinase
MVEIFAGHQVSFVAVTQQFNTTTSMRRLTLNVLLSFALFEREVTGERIWDKIAASKRKGMWMAGLVPIGYEVRDRQLMVVESEAVTVRHIFQRYCDGAACCCSRRTSTGMVSARSSAWPAMGPARVKNPSSVAHSTLCSATPFTWARSDTRARGIQASINRSSSGWYGTRPRNFCVSIRFGPMARPANRCPVRSSVSCSMKTVNGHAVKGNRRYRYYVSRSLMKGAASKSGQGWRISALERANRQICASLQNRRNPPPN